MAPVGWSAYKPITVKPDQISADLSDFPVLVKITDDSDVGGRAKPDLSDVRFYNSAGSIEYPHERQVGSITTGQATGIFWVRVPSLLAASGASLRMYYGRLDAADGSNPAGTWSDYYFVHHLEDATTETTGTQFSNVIVFGNPVATTGKVGGAMSFSGSTEYIRFDEIDANSLFSVSSFTVSVWMKTTDATWLYAFNASGSSGGERYFGTNKHSSAVGDGQGWFRDGRGGNVQIRGTTINDGVWHQGLITRDNGTISYYQDGVFIGSEATDEDFSSTARRIAIASMLASTPGRFWIGDLDEARAYKFACSAARAKFEYHNINAADNELTIGSEIVLPAPAEASTRIFGRGRASSPSYQEGLA